MGRLLKMKINDFLKENPFVILMNWLVGMPLLSCLFIALFVFLFRPNNMKEFEYIQILMFVYFIGGFLLCCLIPFLNFSWFKKYWFILLLFAAFYIIVFLYLFIVLPNKNQ